jgi:hypothetical protein
MPQKRRSAPKNEEKMEGEVAKGHATSTAFMREVVEGAPHRGK